VIPGAVEIDMEPELRLLDGRRARRALRRDPPETSHERRHAREEAINPAHFYKSAGIDPARRRDWFAKSVFALSRVQTDLWVPMLVWLDRHRGVRMPVAYREIVHEFGDNGPLTRRFGRFDHMCIDATHDPKFAEDLEEMWPGRVEGLHITSEARERMLRTTWLWFRLGGALPGRTGVDAFDHCVAEARREMERLELKLTPNGKMKVDHHYSEHNDLADAMMLGLLWPMDRVRRLLGGSQRAMCAPATNEAFNDDPLMRTAARLRMPEHLMGGVKW